MVKKNKWKWMIVFIQVGSSLCVVLHLFCDGWVLFFPYTWDIYPLTMKYWKIQILSQKREKKYFIFNHEQLRFTLLSFSLTWLTTSLSWSFHTFPTRCLTVHRPEFHTLMLWTDWSFCPESSPHRVNRDNYSLSSIICWNVTWCAGMAPLKVWTFRNPKLLSLEDFVLCFQHITHF